MSDNYEFHPNPGFTEDEKEILEAAKEQYREEIGVSKVSWRDAIVRFAEYYNDQH